MTITGTVVIMVAFLLCIIAFFRLLKVIKTREYISNDYAK